VIQASGCDRLIGDQGQFGRRGVAYAENERAKPTLSALLGKLGVTLCAVQRVDFGGFATRFLTP
jgi:hypothetical protein